MPSVAFSASSVTVPAGGKATVTATITPATGPQYGQYGGYIVLTPQGGGQVYRVPFAGFVGDYQGIQALTPTANGFPWLAVLYQGSYYQVTGPLDWVYTLENDDVPNFLIHFEHQAAGIAGGDQVREFGRTRSPCLQPGLRRGVPAAQFHEHGFFAFTWDGTPHPQQRLQRQRVHQGPDEAGRRTVSTSSRSGRSRRMAIARIPRIGRRGPRR